MSVINKKPYIVSVIDTLTDDQKELFASLINGEESAPVKYSLINSSLYIGEEDLDKVQFATLEVQDNVFTGYLIYNETYCVMIAYHNETDNDLKIVKVDVDLKKYHIINEPLSIEELRRILKGGGGGGSDLPVPTIFLAPAYDSTKTYNTSDLVVYNSALYVCKADNTTGTWDDTKRDTTTIAESVLGLLNEAI